MTDQLATGMDAKIRESFARQTLMSGAGADLTSVAWGRVTIAAELPENLRQQQGFAHGGFTFALGDTAAGYAAMSVLPLEVEVMTVEMKINFLAPGAGRLVAEGRILKPGRRVVAVASDVWAEAPDGTRKLIAACQGTIIPVPV
ncbi:PaaI family thioesterase [Chachezhania antarctica]|uniref:PaaI family thioesterase n=1 Tax=Chachezhania antarctica TaxID=2340860 RepID=UPI001F0955A8|nr:PaaI family thioesterase [Chachezhania antarctica]